MMKYLVAILLVALVALGVAYEIQRRDANSIAAEREKAALDAAQAKRKAEEADTKNVQAIIRWKAQAARHEAEVRRLRSAATAAAKEVKAVVTAGETLVASGTADEIMAALRARGYHPARCPQ